MSSPAIRRLQRLTDHLAHLVGGLVALGLAVLTLLAITETVAWTFFDRSWAALQEIQAVLLIWLAVLGAAWGVSERFHIAVELVANRLPRGVRRWVDRLALIATMVLGGLFLVYGASLAQRVSNTLPATGWSASVQYVPVAVGGGLIAVFALARLLGLGPEPESSPVAESSR